MNIESRLQGETVRTPATPVTAKAFISLQDTIIEQDACALDETNKQNLRKQVQDLANAIQMFFAKHALQQDQIRFLITINDEAKLRRSTKSNVLGKANVMSYEDLVAKRIERDAKEQDKAKVKGGNGVGSKKVRMKPVR